MQKRASEATIKEKELWRKKVENGGWRWKYVSITSVLKYAANILLESKGSKSLTICCTPQFHKTHSVRCRRNWVRSAFLVPLFLLGNVHLSSNPQCIRSLSRFQYPSVFCHPGIRKLNDEPHCVLLHRANVQTERNCNDQMPSNRSHFRHWWKHSNGLGVSRYMYARVA